MNKEILSNIKGRFDPTAIRNNIQIGNVICNAIIFESNSTARNIKIKLPNNIELIQFKKLFNKQFIVIDKKDYNLLSDIKDLRIQDVTILDLEPGRHDIYEQKKALKNLSKFVKSKDMIPHKIIYNNKIISNIIELRNTNLVQLCQKMNMENSILDYIQLELDEIGDYNMVLEDTPNTILFVFIQFDYMENFMGSNEIKII